MRVVAMATADGGDLAVAPSLAGVRGVGFEQDTRFQLLPRRVLSLPDHRVQLVALLIAERDDAFFDGDHFIPTRLDFDTRPIALSD